jgi:homoserine O-acetyltransferase
LNAQGIAFHEVGRQAIYADPNWRNGNYLDKGVIPEKGLSVARMLAHITYLSEASMHQKFGRRLREKERYGYDFTLDFEVESYLRYQGASFVQRFDANTYLYITKAIDYFDLEQDYGSLEEAFKSVTAKVLVFSFTSDWLFPTAQNKEIVRALQVHRKPVTFVEFDLPYGHDSFLIKNVKQEKLVSDFLGAVYDEIKN